jgi:hypothetical protein
MVLKQDHQVLRVADKRKREDSLLHEACRWEPYAYGWTVPLLRCLACAAFQVCGTDDLKVHPFQPTILL